MDSSDVRLVVLTKRARNYQSSGFRGNRGWEGRLGGYGSRYLDMEMGWPGANAKLESINFTLQITAILADGGKARTLGNPMIRRVNTKTTQNLRDPNLGRVEYGERKGEREGG